MIDLIEELKERYMLAIPYIVQKHTLERVKKATWFTNLNPKRTLPLLVDHDHNGVAVRGSSAMVSYILLLHEPES
jgi:glutathione S-transferase